MKKTLREYLADLTASVNLDRILRIGRRATKKAQEDNRRMGIPNVYSINGQLYYELPNGELTTEDTLAGQLPDHIVDTLDAANDGEVTATDVTPVEAATGSDEPLTDESVIKTHAAEDEDTIEAATKCHVGKNGASVKPSAPAAVSDPAADVDK